MEMSLGEVVDRLSICQLKAERTTLNCSEELSMLWGAMPVGKDADFIAPYVGYMKIINGAIWDLESDLRRGKEGELGLEEVGRRALKIRDLNSVRVYFKNEINTIFNSGFREVKQDHASAT